ncbi:MAG: hypothetical protein ACTHOU_12920, partial [Aureliella sp.]
TNVTDRGLKTLSRAAKLRRLNLHGSAITDAGLAVLPEFAALTRINLGKTDVTAPAVDTLQQSCPALTIER